MSVTFKEVEKKVAETYIIADKGLLKLLFATIIANRMPISPVWLFIIGASGAGKCLGKGTPVMLFSGKTKSVEDITTDDVLMGDDFKPRHIQNINRGFDKMYRVDQSYGNSYTVNKDHILSLQYRVNRSRHGLNKGDTIDIPIEEYLNKANYFQKSLRGYKVPVDFKEKEVSLEPYFLGLWLGDGASRCQRITTDDNEIVEYLQDFADRHSNHLKIEVQPNKCNVYSVSGISRTKNEFKVRRQLQKYNLIMNKHIPDVYKFNSRQNRLEVLAGLLDSDGSLGKNRYFEFSNKSKTLANDVVWLARSLGFRATINKTIKGIKSTGFSGVYYRIYISGNIWEIPTKIKRKQAKEKTLITNPVASTIKITSQKADEYFGFTIDGNGRFLLGDFTVTHNTAFIDTFTDCQHIYQLSKITPNTFLSGFKQGAGKEPSFLHQIPVKKGGMLVFKDFTTLLAMHHEAKIDILGQMREVYDGTLTKRTGTGDELHWNGRLGFIAATTDAIYQARALYSSMGERFIMYNPLTPDRKEVARRSMGNIGSLYEKRQEMRKIVKEYLDESIILPKVIPTIPESVKENIIDIANMTCYARSMIDRDLKTGDIIHVYMAEVPTRLSEQLMAVSSGLMVINGGDLTADDEYLLYKIALDSISSNRKMVMQKISEYDEVETKGLAVALQYPTTTVRRWLEDLVALGICERAKREGSGTIDYWNIKKEYKKLMIKYEHIEEVGGVLESEDTLEIFTDEEEFVKAQEPVEEKGVSFDDAIDEAFGVPEEVVVSSKDLLSDIK